MDRSPDKYKQQLESSKNWKKQNPERHAELARAYRKRNPEKLKAQNLLNYAIRKGRIKRGLCKGCGTDKKVHAHHHDYNKPYDVEWFCFRCHRKEHPVTEKDKEVKFKDAQKAILLGSENPNSSLDDSSVKQIKSLLEIGLSQVKIAKFFGVHQTTVSGIKLGKTYTNVK